MDYIVNVSAGGIYQANFRYASDGGNGQIKLQLINPNGSTIELKTIDFNSTGGWQDWENNYTNLSLPVGTHQLRVLISQPLFNLNWYEFTLLTPTLQTDSDFKMQAFPNPSSNQLFVQSTLFENQNIELSLRNSLGQIIFYKRIDNTSLLDEIIDLNHFTPGLYYLTIGLGNGKQHTSKIIKK